VCLALYLIADRPLPTVEAESLVVSPMHKPRWGKPAVAGPNVYRFGPPGCACSFLRDGEDGADDADTERQFDAAEAYLGEVCRTGPVTVLVTWMGDERKEPTSEEAMPDSFRRINFDSAWERPLRVEIAANA
jgi:hypothetical protein